MIERGCRHTELSKGGERDAEDRKVVSCQDLHPPREEYLREHCDD